MRLHSELPPAPGSHVGPPLIVPGCRLEWYSGARVCDLLQAIGGLDIVGDSLMRHLGQTVKALAIGGDLGRAVSEHMGHLAWVCECDGAYDDGHARRFPGDAGAPYNAVCRSASLATLSVETLRATWPNFCPSWGATSYLPEWADWYTTYPPAARAAYQLTSGGLHAAGLDAGTASHFFGALKPGARVYLFATLHAPGSNKSPQFLPNFGHDATIAYNALIREHAAALNVTVFDAYAVTYEAPSVDGQHYFQGTNVDLAQLLLNLLAALHRERPPPPPESPSASPPAPAPAAPARAAR